jgi:hypothetical protein
LVFGVAKKMPENGTFPKIVHVCLDAIYATDTVKGYSISKGVKAFTTGRHFVQQRQPAWCWYDLVQIINWRHGGGILGVIHNNQPVNIWESYNCQCRGFVQHLKPCLHTYASFWLKKGTYFLRVKYCT